MNYYHNNLIIKIDGKSHDPSITLTCRLNKAIDFTIDEDEINKNLTLRRGLKEISTPRRELDRYQITKTKYQLKIKVYNDDIIDEPYTGLLRPGHADLVQMVKYQDPQMIQGGGIASGRLTAPLVILGSIFKEQLMQKGIFVKSYIKELSKLQYPNSYNDEMFKTADDFLNNQNQQFKDVALNYLKEIKSEKDSVGGTIETFIKCPLVGLGEPFFNSIESIMSHLIFSIPACNGIKFGDAFNHELKGSAYNDIPYYENGQIKYRTNHSGGINGGLTNGNYLYFQTSFHPTSSIGKIQDTINIETKENAKIEILSRNDPTVVPRATIVVTSVAYIALMDLILGQ